MTPYREPSCFTCKHRFTPVTGEPCGVCLNGEEYEHYRPQREQLTTRALEKHNAVAAAGGFSKRRVVTFVQNLQSKLNTSEQELRNSRDRADALERKCDQLEQKLADERQAGDDQIRTLERQSAEAATVERVCGAFDPMWLLAVRLLELTGNTQRTADPNAQWVLPFLDWQLTFQARMAETLLVGAAAEQQFILPRHFHAKDVGDGRELLISPWIGSWWDGECQAGSEAACDLEAALRTAVEDLELKAVVP